MKKWTAITDGGKYGVQAATTIKIREGMTASFSPSPRYLRTQGLELLPDGEEFEAILVKQCWGIVNATDEQHWKNVDDSEYRVCPADRRRQVLAPLVKDQDEPSVQNDSSPIDEELKSLGYDPEKLELRAVALIRTLKENVELKRALAKEEQDHYYTRCAWDSTTQDRDKWKALCEQKDESSQLPQSSQNPEPVEQEGEVPDGWERYFDTEYQDYRIRKQSLKQSDAVEFAEWIRENKLKLDYVSQDLKWVCRDVRNKIFGFHGSWTTEELYKLFTLKKQQ